MRRFLPFFDLQQLRAADLPREFTAALGLVLLAVPQGVAYALIAGLPPVMGLYAAAIPTIVGSMFRSSKHVVSGPSNAVSLLVGGAVATFTGDPVAAGITIAFTVGVLQLGAGLLGLGAFVDYISGSVVRGYITGAAVLIGIGQLGHATGTGMASGSVWAVSTWVNTLQGANVAAVGLAMASMATVLGLRRFAPAVPGTLVAMSLGGALAWWMGLDVILLGDVAPVPPGLPALTVPDLSLVAELLPVSVAAMMLSLVESSSLARSIAGRTGQRLDLSVDFAGQGLANLVSSFSGGYAVSGSLSRSVFNERAGATSRLAGMLSGLAMLGVLLVFGPIIDYTPMAGLAGIILVIAGSLVDPASVREALTSSLADRVGFLATMVGTWVLPLDKAILLGVAFSIGLFLRRVRHLRIRELVVDPQGVMQECEPGKAGGRSELVRVLHVEGNLFFGAAAELRRELDEATRDDPAKVVIIRLKRTMGMDLTAASTLNALHRAMRSEGRHLLIVGLRPPEVALLVGSGHGDIAADIYPTEPGWFVALERAILTAILEVDAPEDDPLRRYLRRRRETGYAEHLD